MFHSRQHWVPISWLWVFFCAALPVLLCQNGAAQGGSRLTVRPHHTLHLTLNEFSILNVSEMDGLVKYGGSGDFQLRMAKEGTEVIWTVTIDSPRLMELLGVFVGEKTMKLVQDLDVEHISPTHKIALESVKTLTQKLEQARLNPTWDTIRLTGTAVKKEAVWMLTTDDETVRLTGPKLASIDKHAGKPIIVEGVMKVAGEVEVSQFMEKRANTLEVFVMSLCPFAQSATSKLFECLAESKVTPMPSLEFHYLFYKQVKDGKEVFTSLHGEEEVVEDLVQIVIRDSFPESFVPYLLQRAVSGKSPWMDVARGAGVNEANVQKIAQWIKDKRDTLIRKEYDYAVTRYGIADGSPSFVWECDRITNLRKIAAFRNYDRGANEACNH